ncbi:hypothetical protein PsYK624_162700 [Phanerochaete sordida]|uniref:Uncharacterized protein n=1 Tax=Phanerochaete sordida TaxID=48140 RepID=A0A9P3GQL3_9APHY|nr:hypothetical protein PsYK624_162700 [Phanerochaete sordida]
MGRLGLRGVSIYIMFYSEELCRPAYPKVRRRLLLRAHLSLHFWAGCTQPAWPTAPATRRKTHSLPACLLDIAARPFRLVTYSPNRLSLHFAADTSSIRNLHAAPRAQLPARHLCHHNVQLCKSPVCSQMRSRLVAT